MPKKVFYLDQKFALLKGLAYFYRPLTSSKSVNLNPTHRTVNPSVMNANESLSRFLETVIRQAIERQQQEYAAEALTDLFIYPNAETGEFSVLNDDHVCLAKVGVKEWTSDEEANSEAEIEKAEPMLRDIVARLAKEGLFETLNLQKPFSVALVDDDMESLAELYFLDDDSVSLDQDLIKEVDKELGDFFKKLMADF